MTAHISDLTITLAGRQRLTLELDEDFREEYDQLKDAPVDITIKKHRKRRSLDANAYFWVLCDRLAEATGEPKEQIYRHCIRDIGGNCETVCVKEQAADKLRQGWEHNGLGWVTETIPSKLEGCVNVAKDQAEAAKADAARARRNSRISMFISAGAFLVALATFVVKFFIPGF